jgi:LPS-assembly protein
MLWADIIEITGKSLTVSRIYRGLPLRTILATCSALATMTPAISNAQLSIMGVLDSRPAPKKQILQNKPQPIIQKQKLKSPQVLPSVPSQASQTVTASKSSEPRTLFSAEEIGFDKQLGIITARGNVEIVYDDKVLIADTVSYNQVKNIVSASGNVQLIESDGNVLLSEFLEITSDLKEGIAKELTYTLADHSKLSAKSAKRTNNRFTTLDDATYSPCQKCVEDPERPLAWKLTANEIKHDADQKRIEYSDVFFEVFDVPILYFPYFSHPDPTRKRETGLLTPSYGSHGKLGSYVKAPVFVNLSPSNDLTLEPTWYFGEKQAHLLTEYRQFLNDGEMRLAASGTYADGGKGATSSDEEQFRGHIDAEGKFDINQTWLWGFDVNHATDETYIRRYAMANNADNGHLTSDIYTEGFRQRNYMKADIKTYQEQRETTPADIQDGKFEYQLNTVSQPTKTGAFWSLDAGFYGINHKNDTRTTRLAADTTWSLPYTSDGGDMFNLEASLATMAYYSSKLTNSELSSDYSGAQARVVPSLGFSWHKPLTQTRMSGKANEIFDPIVHINVAPNVGNNYKINNEDSQDFEFEDTNLFKRNRYSGLDKYDGGQRIDYGFNWGVYGQEGGYTQLFVGQSYRMRDDNTYDTSSGLSDNLSDIVGRVKVSPSSFLDVLYRYRLDKDDMSLNRSETALTMGPSSTRLTLSHLYIEGTGLDSQYGTREEIYGELKNQISKNWYSSIDSRYRMNTPEGNVSQGARIGYEDECVTIYADVRRNFFEDRDIRPEDLFSIRIELKNLGGFSPL